MNPINQWIRTIRIQKSLDLRQFEKLCGISYGQISRIENGSSSITLGAIVRLTYGLNKSIDDVFRELSVTNPLPRSSSSLYQSAYSSFFTIADIEALIRLFHKDKDRAIHLMIYGYSKVLEVKNNGNSSYSGDINPVDKIHEALEANSTKGVPLPYPNEITAPIIENICFNDGIITLNDLGAYIKVNRNNFGVSLRKLAEQSNFSYNTLYRLEQTGINKILFSDIISTDNSLNLDGKLITISWAASEYQTGIVRNRFIYSTQDTEFCAPLGWTDEELTITQIFLTINRWFLSLLPDEPYWIYDVKNNIRDLL